ncbi:MAG: sulfurtransferase TusA family protein [Anaerolineae bacterium]|nr:sulfurtransferase TusA family protein [Anaerolineae bacterium]
MSETFSTGLEVCYEVLLYVSWLIQKLPEGEILDFTASDPNARNKIEPWAELNEYELVRVEVLQDGKTRFLIRR